jgi:hypothetical protein
MDNLLSFLSYLDIKVLVKVIVRDLFVNDETSGSNLEIKEN